jgi:hypothetical protein
MYDWNDIAHLFTVKELSNEPDAEGNLLPDGWAGIYESDMVYACVGMKTRKEARISCASFIGGIHHLGRKF